MNTSHLTLSFKPMRDTDLPLLHQWLNKDHMRRFYQKRSVTMDEVQEKYAPRIRDNQPTHCHIAYMGTQPIGKLQCYRIKDYPKYAAEIGVSDGVSIDLFIGDESKLGVGLGVKMLKNYLEQVVFKLFPNEKYYIAHEKDNISAYNCSKSAGFNYVRDIKEDGNVCDLLLWNANNPTSLR